MLHDELLHKYLNNEISPAELEEFKKRPEYESVSALLNDVDQLEGPQLDKQTMLTTILNQKKSPATTSNNKILSMSFLKMAAAASVLLIIGFFLRPENTKVDYLANATQEIKAELPDQSTFVLSPNSTLSYDKEQWSENRNLSLEGMASFEVTKGSDFTVATKKGKVTVIGTQFTVESRASIFKVVCTEGKVKVSVANNSNTDIYLVADESIEIKSNGTERLIKDGLAKYKKTSIKSIIKDLESFHDIKITTKNVMVNDIISCNFKISDLDLALNSCLMPLGLSYKNLSANEIKIYK